MKETRGCSYDRSHVRQALLFFAYYNMWLRWILVIGCVRLSLSKASLALDLIDGKSGGDVVTQQLSQGGLSAQE